eukprot:gene7344-8741_t
MPKHDFLSPKGIANRIKSKGLQKLRWYCQMCQKQCRDENGFKCHNMSESHQRQMAVFGLDPESIIESYSEMFLDTWMEHLRTSHKHSRIAATVCYNEILTDRNHIHMNSTKWYTLTEFVKMLGKEGLCKVEDTPKGWFITYIDRDQLEQISKDKKQKRERAEEDEEIRHEKAILEQAERAAKEARVEETVVKDTELKRGVEASEEEKITFGLAAASATQKGKASADILDAFSSKKGSGGQSSGASAPAPKKVGGNLAAMMKEEEHKKEAKNRKEYWICEGIVVKVLSKDLKSAGLYKKKGVDNGVTKGWRGAVALSGVDNGVIRKLADKFTAEIKMQEGGAVVRVDQAELETVIPVRIRLLPRLCMENVGGKVRVVNGGYRGEIAKLVSVDMDHFCANLCISGGGNDGRTISVAYEDFSKLA